MIHYVSTFLTALSFLVLTLGSTITTTSASPTKTLNPTQKAALADYPLMSAFVHNLGISSGYLLQDYQNYATSHSISIPNEIYNYFGIVQAMTNYEELKSEMIMTFPFTQFYSFLTFFPWYSTLMKEAQMTTFFFPQDFATTSLVSASTSAITSISAVESKTVSSVVSTAAVSSTSSVSSVVASTVQSSMKTSIVLTVTSTTTTSASETTKKSNATRYNVSLISLLFILLCAFF